MERSREAKFVKRSVNWIGRKLGHSVLTTELEPAVGDNVIYLDQVRLQAEEAWRNEGVPVTLNLPEGLMVDVQESAEKEGITVTQFFKEALTDQLYFRPKRQAGAKILIEEPDSKKIHEVVWKYPEEQK